MGHRIRLTAFAFLALISLLTSTSSSQTTFIPSEPGADLFKDESLIRIRIDVARDQILSLKSHPREFVAVTLTESGKVYRSVGMHIKGATGSFRPIDDKPSLTLDFEAFERGQRFHGFRRIHLDNSVEDPSYLCQQIGGEWFRHAGIPAARVTHALVSVNGSKPRLYLLREGFTEDFLARFFNKVTDALYEPQDGHDVDQPMKRGSVKTSLHPKRQLKSLAAAAAEPNLPRRWEKLQRVLDVERFMTFMVLEVMLDHHDGYCLARNNFRVYYELPTEKFIFFPHGMDQLFLKSDYPWQPSMSGLVARAIMETPQGQERYRQRFLALLPVTFNHSWVTNRVAAFLDTLRPALPQPDFAAIELETRSLCERISSREQYLVKQVNLPPVTKVQFIDGRAPLDHWVKSDEPIHGSMNQLTNSDGTRVLRIQAQGECFGSWRTSARLDQGQYQFVGRIKAFEIRPLPYGVRHGAGLRVGGASRTGIDLVGTREWTEVNASFVVPSNGATVEFICELRAVSGEAWFDASSLCVSQKSP